MARSETSRRSFMKSGIWSGAALLGLGEVPWLRQLGEVLAEDTQVPTRMMRFRPEIEPLVRLLEETPRERAIEKVAEQIRQGLSYRELLTALMLAGVRNIRPGPVVGSKLHAVLVLNSAHLASQASPPADRWLPMLWAVDEFKFSQNQDVREGDWIMPAASERNLPLADKAPAAFAEAMLNWDEEAADRAMTAWVRSASPWEIYDQLWFQGARDYLHIGHKAIYVANSYRTLKVIGEQHAEGVLRPLARTMVVYNGDRKPTGDDRVLLPWTQNKKHVAALKPGWQQGRRDDKMTRELLGMLRQASADEASAHVVRILNGDVAAETVWQALFLFAAELVMRKPNIFSLHAQTHTNAMHFAYRATRDDATRRFLLLQNVAFMPYFRVDTWEGATGFTRPEMGVAGDLSRQRIDAFAGQDFVGDGPAPALEQVFAELGRDRHKATFQLLSSLAKGTSTTSVLDAARVLIFLKGSDPHDYKFSSAIMEDQAHLAPAWRGPFLAANLSLLRSSTASEDHPISGRIRHLLPSLEA